MSGVSPAMLQAAWTVFNRYPRKRLSPGPGFKEALEAALEVQAREAEFEKAEYRRLHPIPCNEIRLPGPPAFCTLGMDSAS